MGERKRDMMHMTVVQVEMLVERMKNHFNREEGQDMVEYALLAALISIVAIALIVLIGPYLDNLFKDVANALGRNG
jgi:pilus assembly protein Flp/PilA